MWPHYSQSSCENATPSSGTSPVVFYKEVPPPRTRSFYSNWHVWRSTRIANLHYLSLLAHQEVGPNSFIADLQAVTNLRDMLDKCSAAYVINFSRNQRSPFPGILLKSTAKLTAALTFKKNVNEFDRLVNIFEKSKPSQLNSLNIWFWPKISFVFEF